MNKKLVRVALGLFVAIIIAIYLAVNSSKTSNTNENNAELVAATTNINRHSDVVLKQESVAQEAKHTPPEKVLDSNYIAECDDHGGLASKVEKQFETTELDNLIPALEDSVYVESQVALALISGNESEKTLTDKFKELKGKHADNTLLSYDLLSLCTSSDNKCERSVIDEGIALDSQNGAVWLLSVIYELNNNNIERATENLLEASYAPVYEEYWGEHFSVFESAFSQAGAGNDLATKVASLKYSESIPLPNFGPLVKFCKNTEGTKHNVLHACLSMGQRMSNSESTMLTYLIGLSLQESVYKKINDDAQIAQVSKMRKEFNKTQSLSKKAFSLVWQSSQRTSDWQFQLKTSGELAATEYIVDEAIRLSADLKFDPCEVNW